MEEKYRLVYVAVTRARYNIKAFISKYNSQAETIDNANIKTNTKETFDEIDMMLKNIYL